MKITAFLLLATFLQVSARSYSQNVTIAGKGLTIDHVLEEVKQQTGYTYIVQRPVLAEAKPMTLDMHNVPVTRVLDYCLKQQGLDYKIMNNVIVVTTGQHTSQETRAPEVAASVAPAKDTAFFVHGLVVDSKGVPIPLASVVQKSVGKGIETDINGEFLLIVSLKNDQPELLQISHIGYKMLTVKITAKGTMKDYKGYKVRFLGTLVLDSASNKLDETVVVAYGSTSKRFATGSMVTVKAEDIENTPSPNVLEALEGRVAGLQISQQGTNAGGIYNIQIRGANTIQSSQPSAIQPNTPLSPGGLGAMNKPLIVVDGMPLMSGQGTMADPGLNVSGITGNGGGQDFLYGYNPSDIASVTVLKDAQATALYGSRGANGVIIITTKKGQPGKLKTTLSGSYGLTMAARRIPLMNTRQYLAMRREAFKNDNITPTTKNAYDLLVWDTTRYTDWQKILFANAPTARGQFTVSGGDQQTSYYVSAGYFRQAQSYPTGQGQKSFKEENFTLSMNLDMHSRNNKLKWSNIIDASLNNALTPMSPSINTLMYLIPNAPAPYDAQGNPNFADWRAATTDINATANPFAGFNARYRGNAFQGQISSRLSYQIMPYLSAEVNFGYTRSTMDNNIQQPLSSYDPLSTNTRTATFGSNLTQRWHLNPDLQFYKTFGDHRLSVSLMGNMESSSGTGTAVTAYGYLSDNLMNSLAGAQTYNNAQTILAPVRLMSGMMHINYIFRDEFALDLNGTREGSSNFGTGNKYGNFASLGGAWLFSQESFVKNLVPMLSTGKLRASYGFVGAPVTSPYSYLASYTVYGDISNPMYQGTPAMLLSRAANPFLKWTSVHNLNFGTDLYFFKDKLQITVEHYRSTTPNQIVTEPVAQFTGLDNGIFNLPIHVRNLGWELSVGYDARLNRDLSLHLAANISRNENKLMSFPGIENTAYASIYQVGESINRLQLYKNQDTSHSNPSANNPVFDTKTGHYNNDVIVYKNSIPQYFGGITLGATYKGLSLQLLFSYAKQMGVMAATGPTYPGSVQTAGGNQPAIQAGKHWQKSGDSTLIPAYSTAGKQDYMAQTFWTNASYISLKTASLNYALPAKLISKMKIGGFSVYARMQNLFTITGYKGGNPENPSQQITYPLRRILTGGFLLTL